jgi:flagellar biosynthesis protein FliP
MSRRKTIALIALLLMAALPAVAFAQAVDVPDVSLKIGGSDLSSNGTVSGLFKVVALISAISFLPTLVLTATCFTRIAIVLGMTRTALGTMQVPPNTVITGLALFLTVAIMQPIFQQMYDGGIRPYMDGQMAEGEALKKTLAPLKTFLVNHSREKDLALFLEVSRSEAPANVQDVPIQIAIPAFVLSELNTAFQIGFLIALPFLVMDMVVSSVLTSMSMITLPPVVISLPLKLMLFVIVDGWHLIIGSLVQTYKVS